MIEERSEEVNQYVQEGVLINILKYCFSNIIIIISRVTMLDINI